MYPIKELMLFIKSSLSTCHRMTLKTLRFRKASQCLPRTEILDPCLIEKNVMVPFLTLL
jgi:hypothetical protein